MESLSRPGRVRDPDNIWKGMASKWERERETDRERERQRLIEPRWKPQSSFL